PRAGDGAGILTQIPHKFFAREAARLGFALPAPGEYAVATLFLPHDEQRQKEVADTYAEVIASEGFRLLGWRDVPTNNSTLGESVKPTEPVHRQVVIGLGSKKLGADEFERRLYIPRKTISAAFYRRYPRR